jgi:Copper type II ascorbate-dependent monooxygenase, C-terminal domain/Copper type II ascorbate-dependent monooxygenase, N-terminal domain
MKGVFSGCPLALALLTACAGVASPEAPGGQVPGGGGAMGASSSGGSSGNGANLPCDVATVLKTNCQLCHGLAPQFGAPMSLVSWADTQAPSRTAPSSKIWEVMRARVHSVTSPMPPTGQRPLTTGANGELTTLDTWFAANAPARSGICGTGEAGTDGSTGGPADGGTTAQGIGPQFLPCTPNHLLTAHAAGSNSTRYPVPNPTNDSYVCFNFKSPFAPGEQATAWAPIIDDSRVIHHWILFGSTSNLTDGSISGNCISPSVTGTHVAGWAPGGQNTVLDPDVGLVLDYPYFQLQIHYNNQRYADGADASGIAFCSTTTPRTNIAGIVTLGANLFSIPANADDFAVTASCSSLASDGKTTMTVIGSSPHMHLLGTGFLTQHLRGGMNMGDLSNIAIGSWKFDDQRHYPIAPRRPVAPGDILKTTCYYDNPRSIAVSSGTKTSDEMCFDFITVYPYGLANKRCSR